MPRSKPNPPPHILFDYPRVFARHLVAGLSIQGTFSVSVDALREIANTASPDELSPDSQSVRNALIDALAALDAESKL